MVKVWIKTDSHYKVNRTRIRKVISNFLTEKKARGKIEVSFSVVGNRQMKKLNKEYRKVDTTTDVLAFPSQSNQLTKPFIDPPDGILRLGDIVISYPQVIALAAEENILVDDKIDEVVIHAMNNLFGQNHD